MTHARLKRGVLHTFMWAIAYQLDKQFPNRPTRKLNGIALQVWNGYSAAERDILNLLKNRAWARIEERFEGEVNMPYLLTHLYWSHPDIFGKRVRVWIDAMDDEIISHMGTETLEESNAITKWYAEMVDKVVFDYLKEEKRSAA